MQNKPGKAILISLTCLVLSIACVRSVSTQPAILSIRTTPSLPLPRATPEVTPESTSSSATIEPSPLSGEALASAVPSGAAEVPVTVIPLAGPLSQSTAQISGMAWYSETLVLLPQYPDNLGDAGVGAVFTLSRAEIEAFLDGKSTTPLEPRPVPFNDTGIQQLIPGFEGYEAIAFDGNTVYLLIEARPGGMMSHLVKGSLSADLSSIHIDLSRLTPIQPQTDIANMGYESLLVFGQRLVAIYEANGAAVNPQPYAPMFDRELNRVDQLAFPNIEYRITDAAPPDLFGAFWAINYFYPGDVALMAASDPIAAQYGRGPSHSRYQTVERLVQFQFTEAGIVLAETPPIQLVLIDDEHSRNWEAIAPLFGRGFLLATDRYPNTILGFVPSNR